MNKPICPNCQKERRESEIKTQGGSARCIYCIKNADEARDRKIKQSERYLEWLEDQMNVVIKELFEDDEEMQAVIWESLDEIKKREKERLGSG